MERHSELLLIDEEGSFDDTVPRSARHALTELQLKARLLVEERDYYTALLLTSQRAFEDHRRELATLEAKEREYTSRREAALQAELDALNAANAELQTRIAADKGRATARFNAEFERFRTETIDREQTLRKNIDDAHSELLRSRKERLAYEEDTTHLRTELSDLQRRQDSLRVRTHHNVEENILQKAAANAATVLSSRGYGVSGGIVERAKSPPRRSNSVDGKAASAAGPVAVPFIPSGVSASKVQPLRTVATHNVHAMLQTVRKTTYRSPPRRDGRGAAAAAPGDVGQLRAMTRSLQSELAELQAEYDSICNVLGDPSYASTGVARKLKSLHAAIEAKRAQLDAVRSSQLRLDAAFRMNRLVEESHRRDAECTHLHDSLIEVVRQPAS